MLLDGVRIHEDIVEIYMDKSSNAIPEQGSHQALER